MRAGRITYEQGPHVAPSDTLHFYTYSRGNWRLHWSVVARTDEWFYGADLARKAFAEAIHKIRNGTLQWNYKVRVPYGSWDLKGNWSPNPALDMTEQEQREHNVKGGYLDE